MSRSVENESGPARSIPSGWYSFPTYTIVIKYHGTSGSVVKVRFKGARVL